MIVALATTIKQQQVFATELAVPTAISNPRYGWQYLAKWLWKHYIARHFERLTSYSRTHVTINSSNVWSMPTVLDQVAQLCSQGEQPRTILMGYPEFCQLYGEDALNDYKHFGFPDDSHIRAHGYSIHGIKVLISYQFSGVIVLPYTFSQ